MVTMGFLHLRSVFKVYVKGSISVVLKVNEIDEEVLERIAEAINNIGDTLQEILEEMRDER